MKYIINIYKDGEVIKTSSRNYGYNYDWLEKNYDDLIWKFKESGYKSVYASKGGELEYNILFNESTLKSIMISCRFTTISDFYDADGNPIVLWKTYSGIQQGFNNSNESGYDKYSLNEFNNKLYIRNNSRNVRDVYDPTQEYIDLLNLHPHVSMG